MQSGDTFSYISMLHICARAENVRMIKTQINFTKNVIDTVRLDRKKSKFVY
jgi:hypothetical protein